MILVFGQLALISAASTQLTVPVPIHTSTPVKKLKKPSFSKEPTTNSPQPETAVKVNCMFIDVSVKLICCCLDICNSAKSNLKMLVLSAPLSGRSKLQVNVILVNKQHQVSPSPNHCKNVVLDRGETFGIIIH